MSFSFYIFEKQYWITQNKNVGTVFLSYHCHITGFNPLSHQMIKNNVLLSSNEGQTYLKAMEDDDFT